VHEAYCLSSIGLHEGSILHDVDVPFESCHEHLISILNMDERKDEYNVHSSIEDEFDSLQVKTQFDIKSTHEQFYYGNQTVEFLDDQQKKYVFNDPMAVYMEIFFSFNFQLFLHCEDKIYYHLPLSLYCSFLVWYKHDHGGQILD